jgi:hypothetical protein
LLPVLFCLPVQTILYWLSCSCCSVLAVLAVQSCLFCPGCSAYTVFFVSVCSDSPVLAVLFWLSGFGASYRRILTFKPMNRQSPIKLIFPICNDS